MKQSKNNPNNMNTNNNEKRFKAAVILFPGTNCENETKDVLIEAGLDAEIVRWNEDTKKLQDYDAYVLPGGWSYEDRIRAGVIAAKGKIINFLKQQDEEKKPILGICNGCQILVESGLVPELNIEKTEMALAPNHNPKVSGFYCTWINLIKNGNCVFTKDLEDKEIIPMPIAHGEGRFTTENEEVIDELLKNNQIIFAYCDNKGEIKDEFPINPNGSKLNIAAVSNKHGNVMAMMPHPERASYKRQIKLKKTLSFQDAECHAPAIKIFTSILTHLKENCLLANKKSETNIVKEDN
ncbi:MAG: phosphoribosylformylglycinamidine synthase I [bacterium]